MYDALLEIFSLGFAGGFIISCLTQLVGFSWWTVAGWLRHL